MHLVISGVLKSNICVERAVSLNAVNFSQCVRDLDCFLKEEKKSEFSYSMSALPAKVWQVAILIGCDSFEQETKRNPDSHDVSTTFRPQRAPNVDQFILRQEKGKK
jgi:hypothetical protein